MYKLPRGYLSASAIALLLQCPRKYEFRYVENRKVPASAALATGSIVHEAFETYYSDAMEHSDSDRLSGGQMRELACDVTIPEWFDNNEADVSEDEKADIEKAVPELVSQYVDNVGRAIKPKAVEEQVSFVTRTGVPMLAYIDLMHEYGAQETGIIDYKVTRRPWEMSKLSNSLQFQLYSYMCGIPDVTVHNVVKTSKVSFRGTRATKEEPGVRIYGSSFRTLNHDFADANFDWLDSLVERCAALISAGLFIPCSPDSWNCSASWCDYWQLCRGKKY